jgi:hypothetical protein
MMARRPRPRRLGVGEHVVGHAVGRNHPGFMADAKLLENLDCVLHGVPVGTGAHDDADLNVHGHFPVVPLGEFYFFSPEYPNNDQRHR